jgi:hypothetical protein
MPKQTQEEGERDRSNRSVCLSLVWVFRYCPLELGGCAFCCKCALENVLKVRLTPSLSQASHVMILLSSSAVAIPWGARESGLSGLPSPVFRLDDPFSSALLPACARRVVSDYEPNGQAGKYQRRADEPRCRSLVAGATCQQDSVQARSLHDGLEGDASTASGTNTPYRNKEHQRP